MLLRLLHWLIGHDKRSPERALIGFALEHFKSDERHESSDYFDTSLLSLSSTKGQLIVKEFKHLHRQKVM